MKMKIFCLRRNEVDGVVCDVLYRLIAAANRRKRRVTFDEFRVQSRERLNRLSSFEI